MKQSYLTYIYIVLIAFIIPFSALGAQMQSGNYKIELDSVNFGGGRGTSGSYVNESTLGEVATGIGNSTNYKLSAGFQQYNSSFLTLSLSQANDITMFPALGGITGGTSNGSTSIKVTTDNTSGYALTIKASTSPAMQSSLDTVADYGASASNPDFDFTVGTADSRFGFSVEGPDTSSSFKDNGSQCNTGSGNTTDKCWAGLSTTAQYISRATSGNYPTGATTTIKFKVGIGSNRNQKEGTYLATTTVTLIAL